MIIICNKMAEVSTRKALWLAGAASALVIAIFLLYKFIFCSMLIKFIIIALGIIAYKVEQVSIPLAKLIDHYYCLLVYENSTFWVLFYDLLCNMFPSAILNQINYGFAPLTDDGIMMPLAKADESERMSLQLYYRTATGLEAAPPFKDATLLEVSSGRGGGVDFLTRNYPLKKAIGLDLSSNNITWCKDTYKNPKLEFMLGNAETFVDDGVLPPESIDIVISVDSAHLYPNFDKFINQCSKVLKKGGYLCISDFMDTNKVNLREEILKNQPGFRLRKKEVTTKNILHAMDLDGQRRTKLVEENSNSFIIKMYFKYQSGAKGSRIYNLLKTGQFTGVTWVLEKS